MRSGDRGRMSPPPPPGLPPRPLLPREDRGRPVRMPAVAAAALRSRSRDEHTYRRFSSVPNLEREDENDSAENKFNILVAVRCRPLSMQEKLMGGNAIVKVSDNRLVILEDPQTTAADDYLRINKSKERRFFFDEAFDECAGQQHVYERTTKFLISSVLQGFNATVFAYGATGAGKTHTMLGSPTVPGIMMLTLQDLFEEAGQQREELHFEVKCSFLEVYNENIRDLLRPESDYLDIREDPQKGMCVAGISEVGGLASATEIMSILHQANKYRSTEATGANVTSSRSHAVLQVLVEQRDRTAGIVAQVNIGKLSMIDLAGSERASHTNNKGMRHIEGANINRSLLALGNCITALSSSHPYVPYRDSKMTRLLKDSLGGNCRTVMIANVSPYHVNYEDTYNTLKYASRARNIKTKAVRNVVSVSYHVSKYTEIIEELRREVSDLKTRLDTPPEVHSITPDVDTLDEDDMGIEAARAQGAKWKTELMQNFEERVRIKRRLIDLAHEAHNQMVQKSRAQVGISQWESSKILGDNAGQEVQTPRPIRHLQEQLKSIKDEMAQAEDTTEDLEIKLVQNLQTADRLQAELPKRVLNKDLCAFLGLVYRIYVLEVENMDLQEMNDMSAPIIMQKDLEAEALRLQIKLRDQMIAEQDQLLDNAETFVEKPDGWQEIPAQRGQALPDETQIIASPKAYLRSVSEGPLGRHGRVSPEVVLPPVLAPVHGRLAHHLPPLPPTQDRGHHQGVSPLNDSGASSDFTRRSPSKGHREARPEARIIPMAGDLPQSREDSGDSARLPTVEGQAAIPQDRRRRHVIDTSVSGADVHSDVRSKPPLANLRRRRKSRRAEQREKAIQQQKLSHLQLQIEAAPLLRDDQSQGLEARNVADDSQGSSSEERFERPPRSAKVVAAERRGIIEKLNRKMNPSSMKGNPSNAPKILS